MSAEIATRWYFRVPSDDMAPKIRRGDIVAFIAPGRYVGHKLYVLNLGDGPGMFAVSGDSHPDRMRVNAASEGGISRAEFDRALLGEVFGICQAIENLDQFGVPPIGTIWEGGPANARTLREGFPK